MLRFAPRVLALLAVSTCVSVCSAQPEPPIEIDVPRSRLSLFPTDTEPATVLVRARRNSAEKAFIKCRIIIDGVDAKSPAGYSGGGAVVIELDHAGQWYEAELPVQPLPGASPMTCGKLVIRGASGGQPVRHDIPLRIGRGALGFLETHTVQFPDSRKRIDLACLENKHVRAEMIPELGCLSGLYSPESGLDAMVAGEFPLGFLWPGLTGWHHSEAGGPGAITGHTFRTLHNGKPVSMVVTLGEADRALKVIIDASRLDSAPGPLYVMCTAGSAGDLVHVPGAEPESDIAPAPQPRNVPAPESKSGSISLWNAETDESLSVAYHVPALQTISIGSQAPWYNYARLDLAEGCPGVMEFGFSISPGKDW